MDERAFKSLTDYLGKIPSIKQPIATGSDEEGIWWIKFRIDIENKYAWQVIQELGCVVNYISINERLPSVFYPVSPAPYLNGGPADFLSWIIETKDKAFKPSTLKNWLEGRLPGPVDDLEQWDLEE